MNAMKAMEKRSVAAAAACAAAAMALVATGCGTDSGSSGGAGGGGLTSGAPVPIDSLQAAAETMVCQMMVSCPEMAAEISFSSEAACIEFMKAEGDIGVGEQVALVKAGKIAYDAAKAGQCLKAMAASCEMGKVEPQVCRETFTGLVKDGDACDVTAVCGAASYCKAPDGKDPGCPGTCAPRGKLGDACKSSDECPQDAGCVAGSDGKAVCAAEKAAGEGEGCDNADCATGLFCDWGAARSGGEAKCAKPKAAGGACGGSDGCEKGLFCKKSDTAGVCTAPAKEGEACGKPMGKGECVTGTVCAVAGKMTAKVLKCMKIKKIGEACDSHQQCAAMDMQCKGLDVTGDTTKPGTCAALPKLGEACTPASDTYVQFPSCFVAKGDCDSKTSKCVGPVGEGEDCGWNDGDRECAKSLECDVDMTTNKGKCKKPAAPVCQ